MSDDVVISARNLGMMYMLYDRPQDRLKQSLFWRMGRNYGHPFWALQDVSFDVRRGETIGIIGRNGSGKSTLLEIIAGILQPTTGHVQVKGRVAALLELGSGFNHEYTGRENIFLNGAILGISQNEIENRYDEIVAFADIGEFIDQPVKMYSSGMFVRLAFAVTTSLDADVLLIDEALAVGDIFFRQKCYQRLEKLRENGASIILVSHAMMDIEQFCQTAIILDHGLVSFQGYAPETVKRYYMLEQQDRRKLKTSTKNIPKPVHHSVINVDDFCWPVDDDFLEIGHLAQISNGWATCIKIALCNSDAEPCLFFQQGETASFFYEFELLHDIEVPIGGIVLYNEKNIIVHGKSTLEYGSKVPSLVAKGSKLRFRQDIKLDLAIGEYIFEVGISGISYEDYVLCNEYPHNELRTKMIRFCHLPNVNRFAVGWRSHGDPVKLMHHGIANLPGKCQVKVFSC